MNTMQLSELENVAESTRLNCSLVTFEDMEETVKCVECEYECNSNTLLIHHMQEHRAANVYSCEKCDYESRFMDALLMHKNT